jgi:hypothetical protein
MDAKRLRAWWSKKQGLDGSMRHLSAAEVLAKTGWQRSVGGASPYLGLFARNGNRPTKVNQELASQTIQELPSARGCTYVLPACDYALGLTAGGGNASKAAIATATKFLGVTNDEIQRLEIAILKALQDGPLDPNTIRERVGDANRNLGEEGKKRGQTHTLSLGLGALQAAGKIRRIPVDGRLDQQRYSYALWNSSPLESYSTSQDEAYVELARKFFEWIGPASLAHFVWFSGLTQTAAKKVLAEVDLVAIEPGSDLMILRAELDLLQELQIPSQPQYSLIGSIDPVLLQRRDLAHLIDPADTAKHTVGEKGLYELGGIMELNNHAILDRGRIIGLWEFDPEERQIVAFTFVERDPELNALIESTEEMIASELGDFRSFSLDSPKSRKPKIEQLRKWAN